MTPTMRLVCRACEDDMDCDTKDTYGYRFTCRRCGIKVDLRMGWTTEGVH